MSSVASPCHANEGAQVEPLLVNYAVAARLLSISERKLWDLANAGTIPTVRIGTAVRFSRRALEQYIQTNEGK